MKHFKENYTRFIGLTPAARIAVVLTIVLLVPNIVLAITTQAPLLINLANIILPAGIYMLISGGLKRNSAMWPVWFIAAVWAAFQIVLIFLYGGGSPIGVDMLLNVVTTNMSEATELLANLGVAILVVLILYLPVLVWGAVLWFKKALMEAREHRGFLKTSGLFVGAGLILVVISSLRTGNSVASIITEEIFPINVNCNVLIAIERSNAVAHYNETSATFTYNAQLDRSRSQHPQIAVMVIGETSRANNWQLGGYERETNPLLSQREGVVFFPRTFSESNTTHKSVPMLISPLSSPTFNDLAEVKSIITAYKEAGFHTGFISNQAPNHSYTELFGNEADETIYLKDSLNTRFYDTAMVPEMERIIAEHPGENLFFVLHSYGSHFKYAERYPAEAAYFKPDDCREATPANRPTLMNAYDNSIRYTDLFLDSVMNVLDRDGRVASLVYASDHGEDIFDDSRNRFLHASPTPTYYQLHVAMLVWTGKSYNELMPSRHAILAENAFKPVSSTQTLFHTSLDLAGLRTPYFKQWKSVASSLYNDEPHRHPVYLTDHNRSRRVGQSGITNEDRAKFALLGIDVL